ncbi:Alpha/Beta hydrolase protein [Halteromyces radiatus]|uniref:Alpha/Beta hydrolase protein n=1 Tax=Halteromyces radiatus TaxID=101107 RepID=UPI00221EC4D0|nr:Alpha/Beta hydrolase protein [Halteromyces radiatus]KAI8086644.1 Alpha/Beta hydrolase protein [Halteromyces radiatus]
MLYMEKRQMVKTFAVITVLASIYCIYKDPKRLKRRAWERISFFLCQRDLKERDMEKQLLELSEPSIITDHTQFVEINDHKLRIVHIIHELGSKVPLIVFIHGLGGQVAQWQRQLEYFSQTAHVLAIDLLGCGKSEVSSKWEPYTTSSLVQDIETLLLDRYRNPNTVIIAHSYGCSIATFIAASPVLQSRIKALVLISPKDRMDERQIKGLKKLRWVPDWIFDFARTADRRGGLYSTSIGRLLGHDAPDDLRKRQWQWNLASRTSVYKRIVCGACFPDRQVYQKIKSAVLLIGGSEDQVILPSDMNLIRGHLLMANGSTHMDSTEALKRVPEPYVIANVGHMPMLVKPELVNPVISEFLINNCGLHTLSGEWQILNKTKGENKWDLKNYEKWSRTADITSGPIGISLFRAMKVMRQTDTEHCPPAFLAKYPEIGFIIDLSKDTPPYRTSDFDNTTIEYIKFRTVSKIPPTREDVDRFIKLAADCWEKRPDVQIAVHCHYGFNRTGFFIVCYMIERLGVSVPDALKAFADVRPPGIRHSHFVDELYMRYVLHQR